MKLHRSTATFASYHGGAYYKSIKILNELLASISELVKNMKHFISTLKRFLIVKSFYSMNTYFSILQEINTDDGSIREYKHCLSFTVYLKHLF
jgi:hypothetical protein